MLLLQAKKPKHHSLHEQHFNLYFALLTSRQNKRFTVCYSKGHAAMSLHTDLIYKILFQLAATLN